MPRFALTRRTVLRGAAGATVALPALEIMGGKPARGAACESPPKRFLMAWGGVSHGSYGVHPDNGLVVPKSMGTGAGYVLSRGLSPIAGGVAFKVGTETFPSMKADVGVVSGLKVPWSKGDGSDPIPPGGRTGAGFHLGNTWMPQLAGERNPKDSENGGALPPKGSTADQIVADAIKGTAPFASLNLRVQASLYSGSGGAGNQAYSISYRSGRENPPIVSPRQAYNLLFGGGVSGRTIDVAAGIDRRKSVLDAVLAKSKLLNARLGRGDQLRMEQYYGEIRKLETSLAGLKAKSGTMACAPPSPPEDPPIVDGSDIAAFRDGKALYASADLGWSNEELRAQIMCDFVHLAFSCDLARSIVLEFTMAQSQMNAAHIVASGAINDLHNCGHGGTLPDMADIVAWHVKHFSRLASKLRDTVECDGTRVLDHCAMNMLWEGGHGDTGDPTRGVGDSHSTENMICIVAGGAGGLKSGQRVHYANNASPAQVLLTHMKAVGVPDSQPLGDMTEPLPELLRLQP